MWYTGIRATFHSRTFNYWNFYGGVSTGLYHNHLRPDSETESIRHLEEVHGIKRHSRTFTYTGFVGTRCTFNGRTAVFSELGIGTALLRVGIAHRVI